MPKPIAGRMAPPNAPLTESQYALIGEAITTVWQDYGQDINPTCIHDYPLSNIKNESGSTERVAYELIKQLTPFTKDGVYGGFSNGRANISLGADMVGLELEELKNALELRRVVLFVLASCIAYDTYLTRNRKKLCLVDEAWQLLGADKETAESIEEGYRRARKYNGILCMGMQGIEDAYKNGATQAAYNNADWKILLRQDCENLEKLIEDGMVNFSPAAKRMLLSLRTERGHFDEMFISSPNSDSVVRHIPDPFSLLMASTNAQDPNEYNALLEQGHSTMEALGIMLARRVPQEQLSRAGGRVTTEPNTNPAPETPTPAGTAVPVVGRMRYVIPVVLSTLLTLVALAPVAYVINRNMPARVTTVDLQVLVEENQKCTLDVIGKDGDVIDERRAVMQKLTIDFAKRLPATVDALGQERNCVIVNKAALLGGVTIDCTNQVWARMK